jgi:ABC-type glycerol-3-phosphate transport system substrate-binding protein
MERREFIKLAGAAALAAPLASPAIAQAATNVRWWYHFDSPQHSPAELVSKFESENPGIKVQAEVLEQGLGEKIILFKYKRRKSYRRKNGHRQPFTALKITAIRAGA